MKRTENTIQEAHIMPENGSLHPQIAVCDDEPLNLREVEGLTNEIMAAEGLSCRLFSYERAEVLLTAVQGGA